MTTSFTYRLLPLLACLGWAASSALAPATDTGSTAPVLPNHPGIIYEGRYATAANGAVRLGFPGVTAHLRFRGPSLTMQVSASDDIYFDLSIDGAAPTLLGVKKGEGSYPIFQNGNATEHTVALTRRNESWQGTCDILRFELGGAGELLPPPALPQRKLMFIGDSVTCGEMDSFVAGRNFQDRLNSNARISYGMILARKFGAQCHLVSCGGRGLVRDWQGVRNGINAPQFYELALPDDPAINWDHQRYVPDAIGIALGQNDFNLGLPDQVDYVNAYVQFIEKIRRDAPQAVIFLINSPMQNDSDPLGDPRRAAMLAYLTQIVARIGSPKVVLARLSHYPGVPGNTHPTGAEHVAMAAELEPVFRRTLGW